MDWKGFKDTATLWGGKAADMAKKGFQTSKGYAEKTGAWSYEKLKASRFVLKDGYAYEKLSSEKRYAIFCIRDEDLFTKFFLPILPIVFTKAWIESGSIRIIIEEWSEELRNMLGIDKIPSVIVHMDDGTVRKLTTDEDIRAFIKNFSFYDKKKSGENNEDTQENKRDTQDTPLEKDMLDILSGTETGPESTTSWSDKAQKPVSEKKRTVRKKKEGTTL